MAKIIDYPIRHNVEEEKEAAHDIRMWMLKQKDNKDNPPHTEVCTLDNNILPVLCQLLHSAEFRPKLCKSDGMCVPRTFAVQSYIFDIIRNDLPSSEMAKVFRKWVESKLGKVYDIVFLKVGAGGFNYPHIDEGLEYHYVIPVSFTNKFRFVYEDYGQIDFENFKLYKLMINRRHAILNEGPERVMISIVDIKRDHKGYYDDLLIKES